MFRQTNRLKVAGCGQTELPKQKIWHLELEGRGAERLLFAQNARGLFCGRLPTLSLSPSQPRCSPQKRIFSLSLLLKRRQQVPVGQMFIYQSRFLSSGLSGFQGGRESWNVAVLMQKPVSQHVRTLLNVM